MKVITTLAVLFALAQGSSFGVSPVQAECIEIHFKLYDPGQDPPCGISPTTSWSIRVTTSPSMISAGTCSSFALDNLYTDVEFYPSTCGTGTPVVCDIVASGSILSGYYQVSAVSGDCLMVCDNCTP